MSRTYRKKVRVKHRSPEVVAMLSHTKPRAHTDRKHADKRLARGKVDIHKEGWEL